MTIDFDRIWKDMAQHFQLSSWSQHGPQHWRNVESNGLKLAEHNGADETVVRLFAVFHDVERESDSYDPDHGRRAASLVSDLRDEYFEIDDDQMLLLVEAISFHNDGLTSEEITIGTCWDADRMDLPRVGVTPKASLMSTEIGKQYAIRGEIVFE